MQTPDHLSIDLRDPEKPILISSSDQRLFPVEGTVIEKQWLFKDNRLVLLSCDSPYDEQISLYLLSGSLGLLDEIIIGGRYSPGLLENIRHDETGISFDIFGYHWRVELKTRPNRSILNSLPTGARRKISRRLKPIFLTLNSSIV